MCQAASVAISTYNMYNERKMGKTWSQVVWNHDGWKAAMTAFISQQVFQLEETNKELKSSVLMVMNNPSGQRVGVGTEFFFFFHETTLS